ncbi:MAG: hypothetical protein NT013_26490 [Planctomycetia bacterium]|nr:hypothetical protein [Planctomycetia bacterium]
MRFKSENKQPSAPSWRIILWMITLVPTMLIASWFARRNQVSRSANGLPGLTKEAARRLGRILNSDDESPKVRAEGKSFRELNSHNSLASLASVSDNAFGIPQAEQAAYESLLKHASNVEEPDLERLAQRGVPFAVLMLEPDRFRGELITIEGDLRRLNHITNADNDANKLEAYEAWIFTTDSGLNPYRVVCNLLPPGIPFGDQLKPAIRVRATGYFFKRYSYATTGNYHTAPLLLAKTLSRTVSSKTVIQSPNHRAKTLTAVEVGVLMVLSLGFMIVGGFRRRPKDEASNSTTTEVSDFSWLSDEVKSAEDRSI